MHPASLGNWVPKHWPQRCQHLLTLPNPKELLMVFSQYTLSVPMLKVWKGRKKTQPLSLAKVWDVNCQSGWRKEAAPQGGLFTKSFSSYHLPKSSWWTPNYHFPAFPWTQQQDNAGTRPHSRSSLPSVRQDLASSKDVLCNPLRRWLFFFLTEGQNKASSWNCVKWIDIFQLKTFVSFTAGLIFKFNVLAHIKRKAS